MAEPVCSTQTVGVVMAQCIAAALLADVGLTWAAVVWGMCGCIVGATYSPPAGRWRAYAVFGASCLLSAKAGVITAIVWWGRSADAAGAAAAVAGVFFHPAVATVADRLPAWIGRRMER